MVFYTQSADTVISGRQRQRQRDRDRETEAERQRQRDRDRETETEAQAAAWRVSYESFVTLKAETSYGMVYFCACV